MSDPVQVPPSPPPQLLAEGRWLWRRLYVFAVTLGLLGLLALVARCGGPEARARVGDAAAGLIALVLVLYLVAPTAQQVVALLANLKLRLRLERRS